MSLPGDSFNDSAPLTSALDTAFDHLRTALSSRAPAVEEIGRVTRIGKGIATVDGLPGAESEELLLFPGNRLGMAFDLNPGEIGVVLLDDATGIEAGADVRRTGRVLDVPVGDALLGRVIDPNGRPIDGRGPVRASRRLPIEREAAPITDRAPVSRPLQTGIKAIDALIPIGRGQRELILGDRQTGKTTIALDTIMNQKNYDVVCIYCAIGQRAAAIAKVIDELRAQGAMEYTVVVATTGEHPPGLQFVTPYAATSIAEEFMASGRDVLVVYDDLTNHARAYRELSLLLRRPPGREAFPGDIFYIHSRMLERSTHLRDELGGGSLTALPIIETEAQNISAYIPTNLISITDGQVYLSPQLFQQGILPAVDIGRSVSRVGGKAQLPAYRAVAGNLKLTYAQFQELERFSRYGARLDEQRRRTIERGRRVRAILQQRQYSPLSPAEQVTALIAVTAGIMDDVPLDNMPQAEQAIREKVKAAPPRAVDQIHGAEKLSDDDRAQLEQLAREAVEPFTGKSENGNG